MIIAFGSQKGGVGKTTSAVTLGHGLALRGKRVLIVDLDPQGHVCKLLNLPKNAGVRQWYYDDEPLAKCAVMARENLWALGADKTLNRVAGKIKEDAYGAEAFAYALTQQTEGYDAVLLDLAPSLNDIQVAALLASDYVICPTRLRFVDLDGVQEILRSAAEVARHGHAIRGLYILPTFYDRTTTETSERLIELAHLYGKQVWPPVVQDTRISEAPGRGQTIWEYAPECNGVLGYTNGGGKRVGGYGYALEQLLQLVEA